MQKVRDLKDNEGYDAGTDAYGDMLDKGIIDPTKVTRTALQNAASISGLLMTTEALVTELPEKKKKPPPCRAVAWTVWVAWAEWVVCTKIRCVDRRRRFGVGSYAFIPPRASAGSTDARGGLA